MYTTKCDLCNGRGALGNLTCRPCDGSGTIWQNTPAWLEASIAIAGMLVLPTVLTVVYVLFGGGGGR